MEHCWVLNLLQHLNSIICKKIACTSSLPWVMSYDLWMWSPQPLTFSVRLSPSVWDIWQPQPPPQVTILHTCDVLGGPKSPDLWRFWAAILLLSSPQRVEITDLLDPETINHHHWYERELSIRIWVVPRSCSEAALLPIYTANHKKGYSCSQRYFWGKKWFFNIFFVRNGKNVIKWGECHNSHEFSSIVLDFMMKWR